MQNTILSVKAVNVRKQTNKKQNYPLAWSHTTASVAKNNLEKICTMDRGATS